MCWRFWGKGGGQPLRAHYREFNSLENLTKSEEEEEEWLNLGGLLREEAGPHRKNKRREEQEGSGGSYHLRHPFRI